MKLTHRLGKSVQIIGRWFGDVFRDLRNFILAIGIGLFAVLAVGYLLSEHNSDEALIRGSWGSLIPVPIERFTNHYPVAVAEVSFKDVAAMAARTYDNPDACKEGSLSDLEGAGWRIEQRWSAQALCPNNQSSMSATVFVRSMPTEAATDRSVVFIAFRGTIHEPSAWCSNFRDFASQRFFCTQEIDHYRYILSYVLRVIDAASKGFGDQVVVGLVGHSLGGGLVELAAGLVPVDVAVTFNASPVTAKDIVGGFKAGSFVTQSGHFHSEDEEFMRQQQILTKYLSICDGDVKPPSFEYRPFSRVPVWSVYEHGDALSFLRGLRPLYALLFDASSVVYGWEKRPTREVRTNILKGGPLAKHSMVQFACKLPGPSHAVSADVEGGS